MYREVHHQLQLHLPQLHGLCLVQLGIYTTQTWLESSTILHKFILNFADPDLPGDVYAKPLELPIANSSVDVVFMPHILAFTENPERLLAEVDRILVPEGHLILIGFNPFSLWGLARLFKSKQSVPWSGKFLSALTVRKILTHLGFQIIEHENFLYRPPLENEKLFHKLKPLEAIGNAILPIPGGAYILIARKKVHGLTRIKPIWSFRNLVLGRRLGEASTDGAAFRKYPNCK